jgi:phosphatidylinositol alpha-1,6-mannosyltransferase
MPGGIAVFLHHLCSGLREQGNEVTVLARDRGEDYSGDIRLSYPVKRYSSPDRFAALSLAGHVRRCCRAERPDVIFLGHVFPTPGLGAMMASKWLRIPYVVLCHGGDLGWANVSRSNAWAVHTLLGQAKLVLANSNYTLSEILRQAHRCRKVAILHPGVNPSVFTPELPESKRSAIREQFQLGNGPVILSVGRLVPKKNHATVLRALKIIVRQVDDVRYLIVGGGPMKTALEELTHQLALEQHVIFAGEIPHNDLPAVYAASDLFIMPSVINKDNVYESFGIVFVEAGACAKPVIGGRLGGISDAVVDGVTGLLLDPLDLDEIVGAILRLLTDHAYARKLGKNARRHVVEELSWEKVTERLDCYLKEVLGF